MQLLGPAETYRAIATIRRFEERLVGLKADGHSPLDFDAVAESVSRTGRIVVAHEANLTGGFGGELAARVASSCLWDLDAPIERVALPDLPMPAAPALHAAVFPGAQKIAAALRQLVER